MLAHVIKHNQKLDWGGIDSSSACIAIGNLLCLNKSLNLETGKWTDVVINSGTRDAWVVPDSGKQILGLAVIARRQGHTPYLAGPNPGLRINGTDHFLPFVRNSRDSFLYLPCYPPPSRSNCLTNTYKKLPILNLQSWSEKHAVEGAWAAPATAKTELLPGTKRLRKKLQKEYKIHKLPESAKQISKQRLESLNKGACQFKLAHQKLCHIDIKRVADFRKRGRVIYSDLPPKFLRGHKTKCGSCLIHKKRLPSRPKSQSNVFYSQPWETVFVDLSGPFRVKSALGNKYYAIFICARTGQKVYIPLAKRSHFPLVYLRFVQKIDRHPKVLYSDLGGEMTSGRFGELLLIKGTRHITVPRGEHFIIGIAEKAIQDIDNAVATTMADAGIPKKYWDIVGEHVALVLQMTSPSRQDPSITIFEACYDSVPNLDLLAVFVCA